MKTNFVSILVLIFLQVSCQSKTEGFKEINPPFKAIDYPASTKTIDPTRAQLVQFDNGVSIDIPSHAFVTSTGEVVKDSVKLSLQTFDTAAEIIASGIPMTYSEASMEYHFESAGMFRLNGSFKSKPIEIRKGKKLLVNHYSSVYGDFDFFHFEEQINRDSALIGRWKKLTKTPQTVHDSIRRDDVFELKFNLPDFADSSNLSSIKWKSAYDYTSPNEPQNKWVLDQKWSYLELSRPEYGFGEVVFKANVNYDDYLASGAVLITKDRNRIITSKMPKTQIWDRSGRLIKTIGNVSDDYEPVELVDDKYLVVERNSGDFIYDLNGNLICQIDHSYNRHLLASKKRIIYNLIGESGHIRIKDLNGLTIKDIQLNNGDNNSLFGGGVAHYLISPNDELITNSVEGIKISNHNGELIKHRKGQFSYIHSVIDNSLLIEQLDGTLLLWNYEEDVDTKSSIKDFNLNTKKVGRTYYSSEIASIPNTKYILINEAGAENSKLWNFETGEMKAVPYQLFYSEYYTLPSNLLFGYNKSDTVLFLYDLEIEKEVLKIPELATCFGCDGSSLELLVSENSGKMLLNSESHVQFYSKEGQLIQDFKQRDSSVFRSGFISDSTLYTISSNGIYREWDYFGNEVSIKSWVIEEPIEAWEMNGGIVSYGQLLWGNKLYDFQGNHKLTFTWDMFRRRLDTTQVIQIDHQKMVVLRNLIPIDSHVYQLILKADDIEFFTYVYLSEEDRKIVDKYFAYRSARMRIENERQESELKAIRSFGIENFGVYNWDRLLQEVGANRVAAKFEIEDANEFGHIKIFHITELNGRVLISYDQNGKSELIFNNDAPNMLLAILPKNKVAIFNEEDFRNINMEEIKEHKNYTFSLKTIDKPIDDLKDLKELMMNRSY